MKLKQINEAKYDQKLMKKSLGNLMQFFEKETIEVDLEIYYVKEPFVVRNSKLNEHAEVNAVEFAYDNDAEANDLLLVTYMDGDQDDMPKKEFAESMTVFETRQLY